jgi:hypothetical protein
MIGIGLLMVLTGTFALDESDPFPGWNALLPCLGTGMIIQAGGATMIDPLSFLCERTECRYREGATFLYGTSAIFRPRGASMPFERSFRPVTYRRLSLLTERATERSNND